MLCMSNHDKRSESIPKRAVSDSFLKARYPVHETGGWLSQKLVRVSRGELAQRAAKGKHALAIALAIAWRSAQERARHDEKSSLKAENLGRASNAVLDLIMVRDPVSAACRHVQVYFAGKQAGQALSLQRLRLQQRDNPASDA